MLNFFEDSEPAYTQEELDGYKNKRVTYNGEEMTEYEASQRQRAMERRIRKTKRELAGYDAGIGAASDDRLKAELQSAFDRKSVLLKKQEARLKDFTNQTGLMRDRAREQVPAHFDTAQGKTVAFNKSVSQKAVHKAEMHYQQWIKEIGASGSAPKSLAKYYKNKYNDTWEHQMLMGYNNAVIKGDISPLVGFDKYLEIAEEVNSKLIGITTSNGYTINNYTTHFIDRLIGQVSTSHKGKRLGVSVDEVVECLNDSNTKITDKYIRKIKKDNLLVDDERIRFENDKYAITYSITDSKLIQVNPKG